MNSKTTIAVLALLSFAASLPAAPPPRACNISTSIACQVSSDIWAKETTTPSGNDYTYQQALCNAGEDDLSWTTALAGCAQCVEQSMNLTQGSVETPLEQILFGNKPAGGPTAGFCNAAFVADGVGNNGLRGLMQAGANLTAIHTLPVLFFNVTSTV